MTEKEEKKPGLVIKDNRRFDTEGNDRGDGGASSQPSKAEQPASPVDAKAQDPVDPGEVDFSSFIISLGTQALMQLGVIKPPEGISMPVDKGAAKQTIDIISLLEKKTKGNLDSAEAQLIEEVLYNCRMSYVRLGANV